MAKRRKENVQSVQPGPALIESVVRHSCGWTSDGGAFSVGAGCPGCGERITAASVKDVTESELVDEEENEEEEEDEDDEELAAEEDAELEDQA